MLRVLNFIAARRVIRLIRNEDGAMYLARIKLWGFLDTIRGLIPYKERFAERGIPV